VLEVVYRPRAATEIHGIAEYTKAEWGERQAKRYLEEMRQKIDFAAEFPGIGSETMSLPSGYRKIRAGSHQVIYRCTDSHLIVVRVIHEREDVPDTIEDFW